jgi:hypothetical protein
MMIGETFATSPKAFHFLSFFLLFFRAPQA